MNTPMNRGLQLLGLAVEAMAESIDGCAERLRTLARRPGPPTAGNHVDALTYFGPGIVARWTQWLGGMERQSQEEALLELAGVAPATAHRAARKLVDRACPDAAEEDRKLVADYVAAIPTAAGNVLIHDPEGGRALMTRSPSINEHVLLRVLPVNVPPFLVGADLPGTPYLLQELLGVGGFGAVYKATNRFEQNTPPRAIKFCLNEAMLPSLKRERELLNRLMAAGAETQWSDRIVKLYGHNLEATQPFLVYEYVPGGSLITRLAALRRQTGQSLRPAQVLGLVRRICEALAFAHTRGLVHRDLKPSNILVSGNTVKLADFGIGGVVAYVVRKQSASADAGTSKLTISELCSVFRGAGTPLYMSPEQKQGDGPDPRHDLYSLGVIWYQLLVGDWTRELHQGWADELAEEFEVPQKQIDLIGACVGYLKKRPAGGRELLGLLPSPTLAQVPTPGPQPGREARLFEGHDSRVTCLAFLRDSRKLLSGAIDGVVNLWDLESGKPIGSFRPHMRAVNAVACSADGRRALAGGDDRNAWLLDLARPSEPPTCLAGHYRAVNCVAFSPDGRRAITGGDDGTIRLWHVASGRELLRFEDDRSAVSALAFTPDGLFVVSCSQDGTVRIWDSETGWEAQVLTAQGGWLLCLAVAPDGRRAAVGGKEGLTLWSLETGQMLGTFDGHALPVLSVGFSPAGQTLVTGSADRTVRLWDTASRRVVQVFEGHTQGVQAVAFSPDGRFIASAGDDKVIRLWPVLDATRLA